MLQRFSLLEKLDLDIVYKCDSKLFKLKSRKTTLDWFKNAPTFQQLPKPDGLFFAYI